MPPEEQLLSDEDLRDASVEQLTALRDRLHLELHKREEREGPLVPPDGRQGIAVPPDPTDPADARE